MSDIVVWLRGRNEHEAATEIERLRAELEAAKRDAETSFKRRVRGVAAHIKDNAHALKKFDWEGNESRCRELCAMYLEEIALTMELEDKLAAMKESHD